ncbi:MAG: amidohydrolase family protein [Minicystis sp.]
MANHPGIIDADAHVAEPLTLWGDYLEPAFKARGPRPARMPLAGEGRPDEAGVLEVDGAPICDRVTGEIMVRSALHTMRAYPEAAKAGWTPASHVDSLRRIGVDMAFLYPTTGAWLFAVDAMDPALAAALVRAYNRWLHDFCRHEPGFLRPVGAVCRHDPAEMVAELHRFADLGWRAVYLRPNPIRGRTLADPAYEPFWSACEKLDVAVSIHEGTHARVPTAGADRFSTRFGMHACSHPLEQMMALLALVEGGVLERHPGLRVAFLEAGCGWLPYWLWRLDEEYAQVGWEVKRHVKQKPSAYFRRQCFVSVEPGEPYLDRVLDFIGEDNLLFGLDYPHMDHGPGALTDLIENNETLPSRVMRKIFWDNPRRYYGLGPG